MRCPDPHQPEKGDRTDMQLYQEALSCMELIASQLEEDCDQPIVNHLYEQCNSAIVQLKTAQHNPHVSDSLESLLETLSFQQSLLESRCNGNGPERRHSLSRGYKMTGACSNGAWGTPPRTVSESEELSTNRGAAVNDMLVPCSKEGGSLDDVVGLYEVKQILKEAVIMPTQYPQLFSGGAKPWTRLLLYGPPGTGKTKLAKALASQLNCAFYCVSPANIISSWIGESEKMIRDLFQKARQQLGQSIIFIDEIDSLCRKRSQREDEHSRRVKTELLQQLDGINNEGSSTVFILGATNCPWDLDPAFLRRFERRIFVPLPDRESRRDIISRQFRTSPLQITDSDWITLLDNTEGYSGADLTHLTMAAAFQPIRDLQSSRFWRFTRDNKITPCPSDTLGAMQYTLNKLPADRVLARDVEIGDFLTALKTTPRTLSLNTMQQYRDFSSAAHQT